MGHNRPAGPINHNAAGDQHAACCKPRASSISRRGAVVHAVHWGPGVGMCVRRYHVYQRYRSRSCAQNRLAAAPTKGPKGLHGGWQPALHLFQWCRSVRTRLSPSLLCTCSGQQPQALCMPNAGQQTQILCSGRWGCRSHKALPLHARHGRMALIVVAVLQALLPHHAAQA